MRRLRTHLSYANVMASTAVFIALGGTAYAVTALPRNSVGPKQIRSNAVGASELRSKAVRSGEIKDRTIGLRDISLAARGSLRGRQGPLGPPGPAGSPGITLAAAVNAAGRVERSTGGAFGSYTMGGSSVYTVTFNRDLEACYAVASLAKVPGATPDNPDAGETATSINGSSVIVRTRNSTGAPTDLPFHLIVVC